MTYPSNALLLCRYILDQKLDFSWVRRLGCMSESYDDYHDQPCEPGQLGRVVITDYINCCTPFIRYDISYLAEPARCDCGKIDLPALTNIVGNVRGTLKHRDGRIVMFTDLAVPFRDSLDIQ